MTTTAARFLIPKPEVNPIGDDGNWVPVWNTYFQRLDQLLRQALIGPLINAANDGAAATAGVPINGLYRNGSAVMIRVT